MIITVTMNPAVDKTVEVESFVQGSLNRIPIPIVDAGGKGINVSKTINALGGETIATGFLGKEGSDKILDILQKEGIEQDFVLIEGITRTNMKIMEKDGTLTEINEPGISVPSEKVQELLTKLESYASKDTVFVLAGSIPEGVGADIYARVTHMVKEKGAEVFVDADGALFRESIEAAPTMLKPNHRELAEYCGLSENISEEQLITCGKQLLEKGVKYLAVSRGSQGALFLTKNQIIRCSGIPVEVHSTVGAGDAMVAALVCARDTGKSWEEAIKLAMAVSAGAVTTEGTNPPSQKHVEELLEQVYVEFLHN